MRETDEFELLLPWEESRFLSGPGTKPKRDYKVFPDVLIGIRELYKKDERWTRAGMSDLFFRGQLLKRRPKRAYALDKQYRTNFGHLLLIDSLCPNFVFDFGLFTFLRTELNFRVLYQSWGQKDYEALVIKSFRYRFLPRGVTAEISPSISPLRQARIEDDQTIEIELADGAVYLVHVRNSPKKGPMFNWRTAFSKRQYPLVVDATHLRVRRTRRKRLFGRLHPEEDRAS